MDKIKIEVNPFTMDVYATGYIKRDIMSAHTIVDHFNEYIWMVRMFDELYEIHFNYNRRLEVFCCKNEMGARIESMVVPVKLKIITTDNESTYI